MRRNRNRNRNWTKGNVGWRKGRGGRGGGGVGRSKKRLKLPIPGNPCIWRVGIRFSWESRCERDGFLFLFVSAGHGRRILLKLRHRNTWLLEETRRCSRLEGQFLVHVPFNFIRERRQSFPPFPWSFLFSLYEVYGSSLFDFNNPYALQ